jgi:type IV secretory pathway VirB3-like protein
LRWQVRDAVDGVAVGRSYVALLSRVRACAKLIPDAVMEGCTRRAIIDGAALTAGLYCRDGVAAFVIFTVWAKTPCGNLIVTNRRNRRQNRDAVDAVAAGMIILALLSCVRASAKLVRDAVMEGCTRRAIIGGAALTAGLYCREGVAAFVIFTVCASSTVDFFLRNQPSESPTDLVQSGARPSWPPKQIAGLKPILPWTVRGKDLSTWFREHGQTNCQSARRRRPQGPSKGCT